MRHYVIIIGPFYQAKLLLSGYQASFPPRSPGPSGLNTIGWGLSWQSSGAVASGEIPRSPGRREYLAHVVVPNLVDSMLLLEVKAREKLNYYNNTHQVRPNDIIIWTADIHQTTPS